MTGRFGGLGPVLQVGAWLCLPWDYGAGFQPFFGVGWLSWGDAPGWYSPRRWRFFVKN